MKTKRSSTKRKTPSSKIKPFSVYLSPDIEQWLRTKAKEEGRTLTAQAERAIRAYKAMLEQAQA